MATSQYIRQGVESEQLLFQDLIIESIRIYGQDVIYLPKRIVGGIKKVIDEQTQAEFTIALPVEMYIETYDGFEGSGNLFQKFGIEIRDQMRLIVAKRRWDTEIGASDVYPRPFEGDLIYFPLSRGLFEIKFVEHEIPYYQLNDLPVHRLSLELFEYNGEQLRTGIPEIDAFEHQYGSGGIRLLLEMISGPSDSIDFGETYKNIELDSTLELYSVLSPNLESLEDSEGKTLLDSRGFELMVPEDLCVSIANQVFEIKQESDPSILLDDIYVECKEHGRYLVADFGQVIDSRNILAGQQLNADTSGLSFRILKVYNIDNSEVDTDFIPESSSDNTTSDNVTIERTADEIIEQDGDSANPFGFF